MGLLYLGKVVHLATTLGPLCGDRDDEHLSFATCLYFPGPSVKPALSADSCWRKPQLQPDRTGLEMRKERI